MNIFTKITGLSGAIDYEKNFFIYHDNNDHYRGISGKALKKYKTVSFEKRDLEEQGALTSAVRRPLWDAHCT